MEDLQVALNSARVEQRNQGLWIKAWHIGQTLQALVVDKLPTQGTLLRVEGRQLVVPADIPVQKGATLMLEVTQMQPTPTLKILQVANPPAPVVNFAVLSELSQKLTNQVKSLLSRQGKSDRALLGLLSAPDAADAPEPVQWVNLIESLRSLVSQASDLKQGSDLARALRRIGSFSSKNSAEPTLKQFLVRLADALSSDDSRSAVHSNSAGLADQIKAALANLALNQVATLKSQERDNPAYYFEMPLWFASGLSVAELQLTDDRASGPERWQLGIRINTGKGGEIGARIYFDDKRVSVVLSSQERAFLESLKRRCGELESALSALGLSVSAISCQSEKLSIPNLLVNFDQTLDERA